MWGRKLRAAERHIRSLNDVIDIYEDEREEMRKLLAKHHDVAIHEPCGRKAMVDAWGKQCPVCTEPKRQYSPLRDMEHS